MAGQTLGALGVTRAALLPMGADPFLNAYWLRHYSQVWAGEVDELRILMCGQADPEVIEAIRRQAAQVPHAVFEVDPNRVVHGEAIGRLIARTSADHVMLCEDDAFVRRPGIVDRHFRRIESGETDIVGCPRGNTNPKIVDAAIQKWGSWETTESGEVGHSLWPCFLFTRTANLRATDGHYDSRNWAPGDVIAGLGYTVDEYSSGDTFVSASYQLRAMGLRIALESEFRMEEAKLGQWDHIPWFHVGSLSSGYGSHFPGVMPEPVYRERVAVIRSETEIGDWYKRVSFWRRVWQHGAGAQHAAYGQALAQFMADIEIDPERLARWDAGFDRLITWTE